MLVHGARRAIGLRASTRWPTFVQQQSFSVLNRPQPNYPGHVPLTTVEHGALAVGSALGSLFNPRRAGNVLHVLCLVGTMTN